jgi:serine/threonine protein kinase
MDETCEEYCCTIAQLGSALRIPVDQDGSSYHMLQPHALSGSHNPPYVAPELWNRCKRDDKVDTRVAFDGYAVDLWSAGVMLLAMLLGTDSLFAAPVHEDRAFQQICVHGHLSEYVAAYQKKLSRAPTPPPPTTISVDALDLLQQMLRFDPKDRLTLAEVQQHPWVRSSSTSL